MDIQEITVQNLQKMMKSGKPLQLLDVRELAEYQISSIKKSLHIPLEQLPSNHDKVSRHIPVVVYCHHGIESILAIEYLSKTHGFTNLHLLSGGLHAWAIEIDQATIWY
jgi:rhodanese-related sulfurtransferase